MATQTATCFQPSTQVDKGMPIWQIRILIQPRERSEAIHQETRIVMHSSRSLVQIIRWMWPNHIIRPICLASRTKTLTRAPLPATLWTRPSMHRTKLGEIMLIWTGQLMQTPSSTAPRSANRPSTTAAHPATATCTLTIAITITASLRVLVDECYLSHNIWKNFSWGRRTMEALLISCWRRRRSEADSKACLTSYLGRILEFSKRRLKVSDPHQ